jgi:hypothetical protein
VKKSTGFARKFSVSTGHQKVSSLWDKTEGSEKLFLSNAIRLETEDEPDWFFDREDVKNPLGFFEIFSRKKIIVI